MRRTLIVMVKVPRPGRVKTRLGRDIGMTTAAWWFRHQVARLIRRIEDPRWNLVLAVSPDHEGLTSRVWPTQLARWPQGTGNLGDRMIRMMRLAKGPVCLIGADIPGITRSHIARAFSNLGAHDIVFGPSMDGGYWLIGARSGSRLPKNALENVRWSTAFALADSKAALGRRRIAEVDRLRDVDTVQDLQ